MAGVNHLFTSAKANGPDATLVQPGDWNADHQITGTINPTANDGGALGTSALSFSDLFLASGSVINFANSDITITHNPAAGGSLTFLGASGGYFFQENVSPANNDSAALGTAAVNWSDLFLASGGVINFNNGDVTIAHSSDALAFAGAANGYSIDNTININNAPATTRSMSFSGQTGFTVANGANVVLTGLGLSAFVIITESVQGDCAIYHVKPAGATTLLSAGFGNWVAPTSTPAAGKLSIAQTGANIAVYNNQGATETIKIFWLGS